MKKTILIFIVIFSFSLGIGYAQHPGPRLGPNNPKVRALKIATITDKLDLSESESEKFWPIYNRYDKLREQLFRQEKTEIRKKVKSAGGIKNITNEQALEYLTLLQEIKFKQYKIKAKLYDDLKKFLPAKKILLLEVAEHEFNRSLFEKLRRKRRKFNNKR
ncbi:hypothetical protein [Tenacibaculum amylolyticum]|uniref:hypothetical protein n=1 Tax=Tenacibaculum amylolyticum TaxID=104269 RepID=UPI003895EC44